MESSTLGQEIARKVDRSWETVHNFAVRVTATPHLHVGLGRRSRFLSPRPAWATECIQGQHGKLSKMLPQS